MAVSSTVIVPAVIGKSHGKLLKIQIQKQTVWGSIERLCKI